MSGAGSISEKKEFCIFMRDGAYGFIVGLGSVMCLRFRFPYLAPRELLHGLHAATKLSSALMPGSFSCQRSTSIR